MDGRIAHELLASLRLRLPTTRARRAMARLIWSRSGFGCAYRAHSIDIVSACPPRSDPAAGGPVAGARLQPRAVAGRRHL